MQSRSLHRRPRTSISPWRLSNRDVHVLLEKPMTSGSTTAARLIEEARRRRLTLMVDHTFVYTPAVRKIAELIRGGEVGDLYYYDSVRINLGRFQSDVNVLWDLAAHDLAILDFLTGGQPASVSATGARHLSGESHSIAYVSLFYPSGLLAHIHVNWLSPVKVRRTLLGGSRRLIVYDELEPSDKVKVYEHDLALECRQKQIGFRAGDMWAPRLEVGDTLEAVARHFLECVASGAGPDTGGAFGLRVVRILEASTESLLAGGRPVALSKEVVA